MRLKTVYVTFLTQRWNDSTARCDGTEDTFHAIPTDDTNCKELILQDAKPEDPFPFICVGEGGGAGGEGGGGGRKQEFFNVDMISHIEGGGWRMLTKNFTKAQFSPYFKVPKQPSSLVTYNVSYAAKTCIQTILAANNARTNRQTDPLDVDMQQ